MAPKAKPLAHVIAGPSVPGKHKGIAGKIRKIKLRNPELGATKIAELVGCNPSNVTRVLKTFNGDIQKDELQNFQQNKADYYDRLQLRFLGSIRDDEILKTNVGTRVISAGILYDKGALTRGQATQINVNVLLDAVQAIREMRKGNTKTPETIDLVHNDTE